MKTKLLGAYLRIKPLLYALAILSLVVIIYNQFLNHRLKLANTDPWIVTDVISGDRLMVERSGEKLEVQLCGISASNEESQAYLRSLIAQGDGSVILDRVSKQEGTTIVEAFVQLKPDRREIHLNTEMVIKNQAILSNYKACPNAEYFELAVQQ